MISRRFIEISMMGALLMGMIVAETVASVAG
jgi:hypothetical protein